MTPYSCMSREELEREYGSVLASYEACKAQGLKLNMARGKPATEQLDMVSGLLTVLQTPEDCFDDGVDARNYGELAGIPSARRYWADVLGCKADQVFVGGAASLNMMFDVVSRAYTHGLLHSPKPWCREEKVKFLCPAPGYDRHFQIGEFFGAELIPIPMTPEGPDMDMVEELVKDPQVKLIWTVPKYSNPDGIIYSDETIRRFAHLKPAAPDFAIIWDNAYCVHDIYSEEKLANIFEFGQRYGTEDRILAFTSTSKMTFPGSGVAAMALSPANMAQAKKLIGVQTISFDKLNQLRQARYLQSTAHIHEIMQRHADIIRPKFDIVFEALEAELGGLGIASWTKPNGGYFISLTLMDGCAKRVWSLMRQAGVVLTGAGATYPYGKDPRDANLRLAPTYSPAHELEVCIQALSACVRLASLEKMLAE